MMETLKKFWHWADNEVPSRDLFDQKATNGGPLSEEAQEAMQQAVEVVNVRAPDVLHPSGEVLRPAIKLLSFAILEAWQLLLNDERIQEAMREQAAKQAEHDQKMLKSIEIKVYTGKANDIIAERMVTAAKKTRDHIEQTLDHEADAVGYTAYNNATGIEKEYVESVAQARKRDKNVELAKHYGMRAEKQDRSASCHWNGDFVDMESVQIKRQSIDRLARHNGGITVDLKPVTVITVIGEMGVTRSPEHEEYKQRLLRAMEPLQVGDRLSVRVDSRGILFQSTELEVIWSHVGFEELETPDPLRIDDRKLYMIVNSLRHQVVQRKTKRINERNTMLNRAGAEEDFAREMHHEAYGMRVFPGAKDMFTGK